MNTRLLVNLGLLLLCAVLGWFAFHTDTAPPPPATRAVTTLAAGQILRIHIERGGATVAQLQRDDDGWRLAAPVNAAADTFRVQTLIGLAVARSQVGFRAAGNDLTQFGLQPARAIVRFNDTTLLIGDANPIDGQRYVLSDGEVHLLEDNWFSPIFGPGIAWLDPRPLPENAIPEAFDLQPEPGVTVRWQLLDGKWRRTPTRPASDATSANQRGLAIADAWRRARALSVQRRSRDLTWNARASIAFKRAAQSSTDTKTETIEFELARTKDALFFARKDLDVQYRFLTRQGRALLDLRDEQP